MISQQPDRSSIYKSLGVKADNRNGPCSINFGSHPFLPVVLMIGFSVQLIIRDTPFLSFLFLDSNAIQGLYHCVRVYIYALCTYNNTEGSSVVS
jgi:hypothetical protein